MDEGFPEHRLYPPWAAKYGDRIIALMVEVLVSQKLPEGHLARTTADSSAVGWRAGASRNWKRL